MHNTKYPPDAAILRAKVYTLRLCFVANYLILLEIIKLCTGNPPGELIDTANAAALDVDIFDKLLPTIYALYIYNLMLLLFRVDNSMNIYNWNC